MPLFLGTYDLPPQEKLDAYRSAAPRWIATILRQPGLKEYRVYRNPYGGSPQVMALYDFDTFESLYRYMQSEDYALIVAELRAVGAHGFSFGQVWADSPFTPETLKPAAD